jgi:uncharacterized protein
MLDVVAGFVDLLRRGGLRVSTAEAIDAARALDALGLEDADAVRAAFAATLCKRAGDRPTFDDLFALFWHRGASAVEGGVARDRAADDGRLSALLEQIAAAVADRGPIAQAAAGQPAPGLAAALGAAAERIAGEQLRSPLQAGMIAYRLLDELGLQAALAAIDGAIGALGASADDVQQLRDRVAAATSRLRAAVRRFVDDELRRRDPRLGERLVEATLADRAIAQLTPSERAALDGEVQRLAKRLAKRLPEPKPDRRRGRLDVRHTMRRSFATGGVPFDVRRRRRPVRRPRLFLLCDVSDSVRLVSRFFLALVHALTRRYDRIHTFVFVADLGDATRLFRTREVGRATAAVLAGEVIDPWQSSDYGRTFAALSARHLGKIGSRTTVIVLGDARSNLRPPRADVLAEVRRRAHRVLWLNPEPRSSWGWGDSAMNAYAPHCDRVLTVWNVASLRTAVDELIK